jgi:aldehyde dehydrogenase
MQYASQNLIPVTLELGGKSPNIFFKDVVAEDDDLGRGLHLSEPRADP